MSDQRSEAAGVATAVEPAPAGAAADPAVPVEGARPEGELQPVPSAGAPPVLAGADLRGRDFGDADLSEVRFDGADLRGAILSQTRGLSVRSLRGADLTGALLPGHLGSWQELHSVSELVRQARTTFALLLAACVYTVVTLFATSDADIVAARGSADLPIFDFDVDSVRFLEIAPWAILLATSYFHILLAQVKKRLRELPRVFPWGAEALRAVHPWIVLDALARRESSIGRPQRAVVFGLVWLACPATLTLLWLRGLPSQNLAMVLSQAAALWLSFVATAYFAVRVRRRPLLPWAVETRTWLPGAAAGLLAILLATATLGTVWGIEPDRLGKEEPQLAGALRAWIPAAVGFLSPWSPFANLDGLTVSTSGQPAPNLEGVGLRFVDARRAVLSGARLADADLVGADLRGADLTDADLTRACLWGADLSAADLDGAVLKNAFLRAARLQDVDNAIAADWSGAVLDRVDLDAATCRHAQENGALGTACDDRGDPGGGYPPGESCGAPFRWSWHLLGEDP